MRTLIVAAALVAMLGSTPALAWSRDFKFTNNTSQVVDHLSMKTTNKKVWEVTRVSRTEPGNTNNIRFDGAGPCALDVRVTFTDWRLVDAIFENLNFCNLTNLILQENSDGSFYLDWNNAHANSGGNDNSSLDADHARN